jgi:hypothetical protein
MHTKRKNCLSFSFLSVYRSTQDKASLTGGHESLQGPYLPPTRDVQQEWGLTFYFPALLVAAALPSLT